MEAFYNEHDPYAARWIRNLAIEGFIVSGRIDNRDIQEVSPSDLHGFNRVHLFAGIGGWDLALQLAGWPRDREVWTGSCPCQPFSCAGKCKGEADARHLWPEMRRLIAECRPATVFGEQVASKDGRRWLSGVRLDLEALGYAVGAADLCAASQGSPHIRQRLFWVAQLGDSDGARQWSRWRANGRIRSEAGKPVFATRGTTDGLGKPDSTRPQQGRASSKANGYRNSAEPASCSDRLAQSEGIRRNQGRAESNRGDACPGCDADRLGDATQSDEWRNSVPGLDWQGEPAGGPGHTDRLAVASIGGHAGRSRGSGADREETADGCGLGNSERDGLRISRGSDAERVEQPGDWTLSHVIPCRDDKLRRVSSQPGDEPLAYGIPTRKADERMGYLLARLAELGHSASDARRLLADARRNRVGRLRGYGNAIVPQVAAEFIRAFMEAGT